MLKVVIIIFAPINVLYDNHVCDTVFVVVVVTAHFHKYIYILVKECL